MNYKLSIYKAILKYGYSKFRLEILEYCNKNETLIREQYYIDKLKPVYNILAKAGSSVGFKRSNKRIFDFNSGRLSYKCI